MAVAAATIVAAVTFVLPFYPVGGGRRVLAELTFHGDRLLVGGERIRAPLVPGFLWGWTVRFYWKRPGQPWAVYYVAHDTCPWFWRGTHIVAEGDRVYIKEATQLVGELNLANYAFKNYLQDHIHTEPICVILDANPFTPDQHKVLYPGTLGWTSVWPKMVEGSVPDVWQMIGKKSLNGQPILQ